MVQSPKPLYEFERTRLKFSVQRITELAPSDLDLYLTLKTNKTLISKKKLKHMAATGT